MDEKSTGKKKRITARGGKLMRYAFVTKAGLLRGGETRKQFRLQSNKHL
ncbi:hypothetical protein MGMO_143c00110 [Methyloglobulus morosus KoM1]|uniref:Uncharacterized protein n=1 Tax=Methyloglobulus morosus KoM1 TaxID=1116472 RepID=V5B6D4_9GAMM|nr:hypothetical protein MGMO_143c00110 [Methyloglobulus morosus KoM1]